jgi:hypothetical protein
MSRHSQWLVFAVPIRFWCWWAHKVVMSNMRDTMEWLSCTFKHMWYQLQVHNSKQKYIICQYLSNYRSQIDDLWVQTMFFLVKDYVNENLGMTKNKFTLFSHVSHFKADFSVNKSFKLLSLLQDTTEYSRNNIYGPNLP